VHRYTVALFSLDFVSSRVRLFGTRIGTLPFLHMVRFGRDHLSTERYRGPRARLFMGPALTHSFRASCEIIFRPSAPSEHHQGRCGAFFVNWNSSARVGQTTGKKEKITQRTLTGKGGMCCLSFSRPGKQAFYSLCGILSTGNS